MNKLFRSIFSLLIITLSACGTNRNLVYLSDLRDSAEYKTKIENNAAPRIQPDDLLSITVSSLSPEANILFNTGLLTTADNTNNAMASNKSNEGYMVDNEGAVNFPVIGQIKLAGLTKEEATAKMTYELKQHVKKPIVNVRFMNFKVTVVGEVHRPSTFTIPTEKINIIEALGLAGDMTPFGKRENVLIIREKDGVRSAARVNMNNKDVLMSPYFYLQQNDIVYVEPDNKTKVAETSANNRFIPIVVASITAIAIFFSRMY